MSQRSDNDTPWKLVLEAYFPECLQFFFPDLHEAIDWSRPYEFLDKELQQVVRDAELGRRFADTLVKVWLNSGEELWILIHIEVQGHKDVNFPQRMYQYNYRISDRYDRPVVSLALLCDPSPTWRPTVYEQTTLGCQIRFEFLSVKLLDYRERWSELETSDNPFATVVMAHLQAQATRKQLGERKTWKFNLIRRLYEKGYDREDILNLFLFIDWVMRLSAELEQAFWQELQQYEEAQRMPYISSVERMGITKGLEQGRQEGEQVGLVRGRQELLVAMLESRFGEVDRALLDLIPHLLQLPNREATQLILQRSREELIAHFKP